MARAADAVHVRLGQHVEKWAQRAMSKTWPRGTEQKSGEDPGKEMNGGDQRGGQG